MLSKQHVSLLAHFQASSFVIVVSVANGDDDLCHNCEMLWHVWKVPIDMPCRQCDMMLRWWVLIGSLWHCVVEAGVISVCWGGCAWSNDGCRWWLSVATMTLLMKTVVVLV